MIVFEWAVGLSVANLEEPTWDHGLLAAVATWCVFGLLRQCRDLWHARRRINPGQVEERWGWRMALSWRVGVIGVFVLLYIAEYLAAFVWLETEDEFSYPTGACMRETTLVLCLLILVYGPSRRLSALSRRPYVSRLCNALAWTGLGVACLWICIEKTLIPFLVHAAIQGIRGALPLRFFDGSPNPDAYIDIRPAVDRLWWASVIVASFLPVNVLLLCQLARHWKRGRFRRTLVSLGLCLGLGVAAAYVVWIYAAVFPRISPEMAANSLGGSWDRWLFASIVLVIFTTACTFRFLSSDGNRRPVFTSEWKDNERRYYQQHRGLLGLLCVACVATLIRQTVASYSAPFVSFTPIEQFVVALGTLFTANPTAILLLAVLLASLRGLFQRRSAGMSTTETGPFTSSPKHFAAVWLATLATIATGIPTLYWFGFAIWLVAG
ncbi:MAG: hypothetical protein H8E44_20215 [Planctomycetes bacterium]|nr:hypothetical protein [Planctomycetota bacterium]